MSPQPLSRVRPNATIDWFTPPASARPTLAAKILEVIVVWSKVELEFINLAALFLEADFEVVTDMLSALTQRRIAIRAAAESYLEPDDFGLFEDVERAIGASRDRRNAYAHHIWAIADEIPDGLLLTDPKHLARSEAEWFTALEEHEQHKAHGTITIVGNEGTVLGEPEPPPAPPDPEIDDSLVMVYRDSDVSADLRAAQDARHLVAAMYIAFAVLDDNDEERSELLRLLQAQQHPLIPSTGSSSGPPGQ